MNEVKNGLVRLGIGMVPYLLVALGYTELTNGHRSDFWIALGMLLGVRVFLGLIDSLGNVLTYRLYARSRKAREVLRFLQANHFPKRLHREDNLDTYLWRIESGQYREEIAESVKTASKYFRRQLEWIDEISESDLGPLYAARWRSAAEAGLDLYSPRPKNVDMKTLRKEAGYSDEER